MKFEKLSEYAKRKRITYRTAQNHYASGKIPNAYKDETGHIIIPIEDEPNIDINAPLRAIVYCRVSSNNAKENLIRQQERMESFSTSNGYIIKESYKEVASGMNDNRKYLNKVLMYEDYDVLIVENRDRLTRFGFNYIETLLNSKGKKIIVANKSEKDDDLISDLTSFIYSFTAKLYGKRIKKEDIEKFLSEK